MRFKVWFGVMTMTMVGLAFADAPTPPAHNERDYRSIGGGLFLRRDDDFSPDDDGNIEVLVFSHQQLSAGGDYSFHLIDGQAGVRANILDGDYKAGALGMLHGELITIDCVHRTYAVVDTSLAAPEPTWRRASTLPALEPVFRYVCKR